MPTTKRIRRNARAIVGVEVGSTRWQLLMYGFEFIRNRGEGFASEAEERAAWIQNREELMAAARNPGDRPHAYFKFDLGVRVTEWTGEIAALMDRDLIDAAEVIRIESTRNLLAPLADDVFAVYDDIPRRPKSFTVDLRHALELELAARWHTWRGRPELATKFSRRAQNVRHYFNQKETR